MAYDKKRVADNISAMIKARELKIGDVERAVGLSTGYFSRLSKDGNNTVLNIKTLIDISDFLQISLDVLVKYDIGAMSTKEQTIVAFLEQLHTKTLEEKIEWRAESKDDLLALESDLSPMKEHPLFYFDCEGEKSECGSYYHSQFHKHKYLKICSDMYNTDMDEHTHFYIAQLSGDRGETFIEATIVVDDNKNSINRYIISPLCSVKDDDTSDFAKTVRKLYVDVQDMHKDVKLEPLAKDAIEKFLGII